MEPKNPTMLESSGEDAMLIETVKSIVTQRERNESETEDDFFLVSQDQDERYSGENVDEMTSHKHETKEILAWVHFCRTCANACDNLIPIFEDEGVEHDLPSKILKYLPIHISKSDTLPLKLCHHCAGTLLAWHELSEGCLSAEKKLLKMQETLENKQQYYPASLDNLEVSTLVTTITPSTVSNTTNSQPDQQIGVKNREHGVEEINKSNRLKNPIRHDRTTVHSYSRQRYKIFAEKYKNKICSFQTEVINTIDEDSKNISSFTNNIVHDQPIECLPSQVNTFPVMRSSNKSTNEQCKQTNKNTKDKGFNPIRLTHTNCAKEKDISMEYTAEMDESITCLKKNIKQSKIKRVASIDEAAMICKLCNKKFPSRKSYWTHVRTHTGEKSYTCHICGKQFIQSGSLYYHLKHVHDGVKNHACDICGRSFAMKTAMEDHRRIHTGERPYVCHTCGKTFKTKASLYIHSKTHTDEFPHKCIYCAKRFRWRQRMLGHLTVHTGEKSHTCDICGKGFGVKNDLTRHKRVHSEEKPYTCQQCGISFGQKRYLKSHERLKLGMCGYSQE
ncbi:zinc finger protein 569-like isoform X1 [Camponotus floridanus]|uniref:zinc finger protein 569-like isoform X1 n=1 Tax=Camponotus floridanus TaxID=104421 RepID=UPI000DC673DC|nr:zinc finger protein 569-like isoform X1 [Camponotus floridanus]